MRPRRTAIAESVTATLIAIALTAGCQSSIPTADDFGMTREEMERTPSVAAAPPDVRVEDRQYASNGYSVHLRDFDFVAAEQKSESGCWAACIQMICNWHNIPADQNEIIRRAHGKLTNGDADAGSVRDVLGSLLGPGRSVYISNGISNWMEADLTNHAPVLIALRPESGDIGHGVVLAGMKFSFGPQGQVIVHEMQLFDPVDGEERTVTANEIRPRIAYTVHFRSQTG